MKIAFTSCFDALDDHDQVVWGRVAGERPDALLLLGDSIYMDFGLAFMSDHPLGRPRKWDDERFANEMYARYKSQSEVLSFRDAVSSVQYIGATWDDHDFGWNGAAGRGNHKKKVLPENKKLIARVLHLQFREWLRTKPLPNKYPPLPDMTSILSSEDSGIEELMEIDSVQFLMTDGRYYREHNRSKDDYFDTEEVEENLPDMLGENQRTWLSDHIGNWQGISIICSGSTLTGRSDSWEQHMDLEWLANQNFSKTIVLSGDIHKTATHKHKGLNDMWEFTASGAARPKLGGGSGNFGILAVDDEGVGVSLFDDDGLDKEKIVRL